MIKIMPKKQKIFLPSLEIRRKIKCIC